MPLHSAFEFLLRMRPDLADEGPERTAPALEPFPIDREHWQVHAQTQEVSAGWLVPDRFVHVEGRGPARIVGGMRDGAVLARFPDGREDYVHPASIRRTT